MTPNIENVEGEPVVRRFYMVPWVTYQVCTGERFSVPIIGHAHHDKEYFNAASPHYHIDRRFVNQATLKQFNSWTRRSVMAGNIVARVKEIVHRERRKTCCVRRMPKVNLAHQMFIAAYRDHRIDPANPVCPHKGFNLSGQPVRDGVIQCPLHGLCWDAVTGEATDAE
jgi:nitrite reductase/ring-hydroxylating ferredoxin subunit